ncbi:hypothetical protein EYF80_054132 [Liparis tanakae]|uniref:Uncharacterized protein n=1 Tax=Liparis tanakae TaxID=230148 RepID=A0A4Z2F484_9TELE|nr:hypothetical protein EYF80_054132 [Liparis tanakae]
MFLKPASSAASRTCETQRRREQSEFIFSPELERGNEGGREVERWRRWRGGGGGGGGGENNNDGNESTAPASSDHEGLIGHLVRPGKDRGLRSDAPDQSPKVPMTLNASRQLSDMKVETALQRQPGTRCSRNVP